MNSSCILGIVTNTGSSSLSESQSRTFVEFFAGVGLVHEALNGRWQCVLANDNDLKKVAAYAANFPSVPLSSADIRDLRPEDIPQVDLATASFPCIDLSQAGGRVGIHGEYSGVVWAFLDHIRALKREGRAPRFLLLENVPGLLTLHGGRSIDLLLREVADLGYAIDLVQVDARHFLPQTRNRVFVLAGLGLARSLGTMPDTHIRRYKVREVFQRNRHLPWHFFNFPALPERQLQLREVLEDIDESDARWWNAERLDYFWRHLEHDHFTRLKSMVDAGVTTVMTAVRRGRRRGLREQIFNLRFDGLASCLRTPKGGSSIQFIVQVRSGQVAVRRITGLESARLQGVRLSGSSPDFVMPETEQAALHAFGDAVCVPAVRWVVEHTVEAVLTRPSLALAPVHGQFTLDLPLTG